jgi:hypothetical protein
MRLSQAVIATCVPTDNPVVANLSRMNGDGGLLLPRDR